jgi:hypothetical protein
MSILWMVGLAPVVAGVIWAAQLRSVERAARGHEEAQERRAAARREPIRRPGQRHGERRTGVGGTPVGVSQRGALLAARRRWARMARVS